MANRGKMEKERGLVLVLLVTGETTYSITSAETQRATNIQASSEEQEHISNSYGIQRVEGLVEASASP